jgi:hypothetical protein
VNEILLLKKFSLQFFAVLASKLQIAADISQAFSLNHSRELNLKHFIRYRSSLSFARSQFRASAWKSINMRQREQIN